MKKKVTSKLKLHKETLLNLNRVVGGQAAAVEQSEGVKKCLITDCSPCNAQVVPGDPAYPAPQESPLQPGDTMIAPRP